MSEENTVRILDENQKLERFIETVRAEANARRDEILAETKAIMDEKIAAEREKSNAKSPHTFSRSKKNLIQNINKRSQRLILMAGVCCL